MMKGMKCNGKTLGAVLIGILFLVMGVLKLTGVGAAIEGVAAMGLPVPQVFVVIAIIVEIAGGLALISGKWRGRAAMVLAVYLLIITLVAHNQLSNPMQMSQFLKNLAIIGGLMLLCPSRSCKEEAPMDGCCGGGCCESK